MSTVVEKAKTFGASIGEILRAVAELPCQQRKAFIQNRLNEVHSDNEKMFRFEVRTTTVVGPANRPVRITVFVGQPIDIVVAEDGTVLQQIVPDLLKAKTPYRDLWDVNAFSVWANGSMREEIFPEHSFGEYDNSKSGKFRRLVKS